MNIKPRIQLGDTLISAVSKLSEGIPGATIVLTDLAFKIPEIDPDAILGPWSHLAQLDIFGIYGSRIWSLYKDVCGQNLVNMIGLLRAVQLGFLSESRLNHVIDGMSVSSGWVEGYVDQVKRQLPNFAKAQK